MWKRRRAISQHKHHGLQDDKPLCHGRQFTNLSLLSTQRTSNRFESQRSKSSDPMKRASKLQSKRRADERKKKLLISIEAASKYWMRLGDLVLGNKKIAIHQSQSIRIEGIFFSLFSLLGHAIVWLESPFCQMSVEGTGAARFVPSPIASNRLIMSH